MLWVKHIKRSILCSCALIRLLASAVCSSVIGTFMVKLYLKWFGSLKHGCFFHFCFCRPLTLGECYTGQPACSIRPANHALAYICLYPLAPYPFWKTPLRVALFKLNHRLLRFWAAIHSTPHCLLLFSSIILVCASILCVPTPSSVPDIDHTERRLTPI